MNNNIPQFFLTPPIHIYIPLFIDMYYYTVSTITLPLSLSPSLSHSISLNQLHPPLSLQSPNACIRCFAVPIPTLHSNISLYLATLSIPYIVIIFIFSLNTLILFIFHTIPRNGMITYPHTYIISKTIFIFHMILKFEFKETFIPTPHSPSMLSKVLSKIRVYLSTCLQYLPT